MNKPEVCVAKQEKLESPCFRTRKGKVRCKSHSGDHFYLRQRAKHKKPFLKSGAKSLLRAIAGKVGASNRPTYEVSAHTTCKNNRLTFPGPYSRVSSVSVAGLMMKRMYRYGSFPAKSVMMSLRMVPLGG